MNVEEAVAAVTDGADKLLSCLGQPFVAYHVTRIMREVDVGHAHEMQQEFLERNVETLVLEGFEDAAAARFASLLNHRVDLAWQRLHSPEALDTGQRRSAA
jgi:hypothetical protein